MKKPKNYILLIFSITILSLLTYGILFYFNFFQGFITIKDNTITSDLLPDSKFTSSYKSESNFSKMTVSEVSDVFISVLGTKLNTETILYKSQRYYIPLELICSTLNYSLSTESDSLIISNQDSNYIISNDECIIDGITYQLRGGIITQNNSNYISISDIEYIFNLIANFDFDNREVSLLLPSSYSNIPETQPSQGKIALIRLEDFSASDSMLLNINQLKFKAIGQFLNSQGMKFHIAWVPRYKCPSDNIDNDLLSNYSMNNVGFINLLDYLINKGGQVGLHGYDHQSEDQTSLNGIELSWKYHSSESETRQVIENSIDSAIALNIPYTFFESPHYRATCSQKKIVEEYFQYLYEPKNPLIYHKLYKDNENLYIPTPLSYVKNLDVSYIEKELSNPRPGELSSLYYHPTLELDFINIIPSNNTFEFEYCDNSPLQKIVKSIKANDYVTIHVTELINK
ncbi:DUF2334 domain-containing protein [Clostridium vincentii]|uniref:Copper amine oxidase-like N-terminal domain-containing protein n=1 Tax=Clostridium vincentii TaxID=52704 RepID=A0A2T0B7W6_9CLOT|nr:DUF2334 domain-containing protein [Clostridium vincentii]PRR79981.1 hypothetical protein CLVI_31680 [Clostridium vincentii]